LVYSLNDKESLDLLVTDYIPDANHYSENVPKFVVGNKIDLERKVTSEEGKEESEKLTTNEYFETSALTGEKVLEMFTYVATTLVKDERV